MKLILGLALALPLATSMDVRAAEENLSHYPCNVFNPAACFRLPANTHLDYSVPADFDLYRVLKGDAEVAVIYVGSAPRRPEGSLEPRIIHMKGARAEVYDALDGSRVEILISVRGADSKVHIISEIDPVVQREFVALLTGLRGCRYIRAGGQKCAAGQGWGELLVKAVRE